MLQSNERKKYTKGILGLVGHGGRHHAGGECDSNEGSGKFSKHDSVVVKDVCSNFEFQRSVSNISLCRLEVFTCFVKKVMPTLRMRMKDWKDCEPG